MKAKPYVGITGPITKKEVASCINGFAEAGYSIESPHIPMRGYLASYKTLNKKPTSNRRYPSIADLPGLLKHADNKVLTMIHYNSREMSTLADQVKQIFEEIYHDMLCRSIQLNIIWPDINQVKLIKQQFPELQIVFQASHNVIKDKTPKKIVQLINRYGNMLDYVLIDPSGGRGVEFKVEHSLSVYNEIREKLPKITVGFAGGLTGKNVDEQISKIISRTEHTDFCIDAEGGLRDKLSDKYGDDLLNLEKVRSYLQSASRVLK